MYDFDQESGCLMVPEEEAGEVLECMEEEEESADIADTFGFSPEESFSSEPPIQGSFLKGALGAKAMAKGGAGMAKGAKSAIKGGGDGGGGLLGRVRGAAGAIGGGLLDRARGAAPAAKGIAKAGAMGMPGGPIGAAAGLAKAGIGAAKARAAAD